VCIFSTLIIWELNFKVQTSLDALNFIVLVWIQAISPFESFSTGNIEYISSREALKRAYGLYPNRPVFSSSPLHSSSSIFKLLSMASYGGELLLDSSSTWSDVSIHLSPSPFRCNQTSRSKGIHWWRRSKAYKLHMM